MKILSFIPEVFKNKFSHRVTGLFLLSALIPLSTSAYIANKYISNLLVKQSYTQLQHESKYYATAIYEKLLSSETKLNYLANLLGNNKDISYFKKQYLSENFKQIDINEIKVSEYYRNIDLHKSYITTNFVNQKALIYMSRFLLANNKKAYKIKALISPAYLWTKDEYESSIINKCITTHKNAILFCSGITPNSDILDIKNNKEINFWKKNGIEYISAERGLFLKARFNTEKWKIIFTREKSDIFEPAKDFNKLFSLSSILTLLVVVLLSVIQIRRSLDPLEKLIQGTKHLANRNFNERIKIKSGNEFHKLAESFNDMGEQLNKQFSALTTLSSIDQLILSSPTSENIYLSIFKYINDIEACKVISITLINQDSNTTGNTFIYDTKEHEDIIHERVFIDEKDFELLEHSSHTYLKVNTDNETLVKPILKYGINEALIFSVKIDNHLSAFITMGYTDSPNLSPEDALQIKNISDRLAVAISTVARDKKLYQQSYYDNLTGLPNRQLLDLRLEQEISKCIRNNSTLAILFLDLDRFKKVNDSLGHTIGDELLVEIAKRLLKCVRETDTVARLGGDEFTIILTGSVKNTDVSTISEKIIYEISKPFYVRGNEIFIGTSIGISIYPNDGINRVELLKNADTAMYRVKELGRGKHLFFEEQMNIDEMERANLENDMRNAFERNEFSLFYQPIIDLESELIVAAETLIRWKHPIRGLVPTEKFICLAEETGFMEKIGEWVLYNACKQFTQWASSGYHIDYLAINVSTRQFLQDNFIDNLYKILNETGMSSDKLELEITEGLLMDERFDSNEVLHTLKDKNIKLSIDDFGTGFSSLSYLKRFPLNTLKIDRSFLHDMPHDKDACSIVESIVTLGHTLNLKVIAEGIETVEQLELLKSYGCDFAQGYYFKRPIPADEFAELINRQNNVVKINF